MSLKGNGTSGSASKQKKHTQPKKTSVPKKQEIKVPVLPDKLFENSPIMTKFIKVNMNGNEKLVQIPCPNISYIKKQKLSLPDSSGRISDKVTVKASSPVRISEIPNESSENNTTESNIGLPCPLSYFDFPEDEKDENRKQAKAKLEEVYKMINDLNLSNYNSSNFNEYYSNISKIYKMIYEEIFAKYAAYPDICMIARLYLNDLLFKTSQNSLYSSSYLSKYYAQLETDYKSYEKSKDDNISKVISVINSRKVLMEKDNKKILAQIEQTELTIKNYEKNLEEFQKMTFNNNDASSVRSYIDNIASYYSSILYSYVDIYKNYIWLGDYQKAHSIFDCNLEKGELKMSGSFIDKYNEQTFEVTFKYNEYDPATGKNLEKSMPIKSEKKAEDLLYMINSYCSLETQNVNEQKFNEKDNLFEQKIVKCCEYIEKFEPSKGNKDNNKASEVISADVLKKYKENAYSNNVPGYETYYKNKPVIKKLYFSRIENVELTSEDIPAPTDQIMLKAEIDYALTKCPLYSFKMIIGSEVSGRTKEVTLKQDNFTGGFYATFKPNENDIQDSNVNNLITNIEEPSIAVAECEDLVIPNNGTLALYSNNYFKNHLGYSAFNPSRNSEIKNSLSFLQSGGCEKIYCKIDQTAEVLIKNQASWFILYGHGRSDTGSAGEYNGDNKIPVIMTPSNLKVEGYTESSLIFWTQKIEYKVANLIDDYGNSFYQNVKILILGSCDSLGTYLTIKSWYNVLPQKEKLILGYTGNTDRRGVAKVLDMLNVDILQEKNIDMEFVAKQWVYNNEAIYNKVSSLWKTYSWIYILNDKVVYKNNATTDKKITQYTPYKTEENNVIISVDINDLKEYKENNK